MIHDLDKTVEVLLKQELIDFKDLEISFATPDNEFAPNGFAVNLFLYDVRENRELRSNELYVERQLGGAITKRHSPVRVDCSYLITAHAKGQNPQGEHRLLGAVMKALLRYPTLPPEVLQGELREKRPRSRISRSLRLSCNPAGCRVWASFGRRCKESPGPP